MTTTNKTVLGIVIAAVVILIAVFALSGNKSAQTAGNQTGVADSGLQTNASDTSDAALSNDAATIDSQMSASDQDSATVQQGIAAHAQAQ